MTVLDDVSEVARLPRIRADSEQFDPPSLPETFVARPQLVDRLQEAEKKRLVVVTAPAGYGKSILLANWARSTIDRAVIWFTITRDVDAADVATQLCAALTVLDGRPRDHLAGRVHPGSRSMGTDFVTELLADAAALAPTTFVLDDFHNLAGNPLAAELASMIELAPPQIRFILSARIDPPVSWHRLRLIDEVAELRADDLRFDIADTSDLVRKLTGLDLPRTQLATLLGRTEGWVTGLQLVSLSLRSIDDVDAFIDVFAGNDRHVAEYLTEHVLDQLEPEQREFLLQTSVLDQLSGSLCDAVTGRAGGAAMLEQLSDESLFVTTLDRRRTWYRCHQLFRDLLRSHLRMADPTIEAELLGRAAQWHLELGDIEAAGPYLVATGDDTRILDAVHSFGRGLYRSRQITTVIRWLEALSPRTRRRCDVALLEAGCRMLARDPAAAQSILDDLNEADGLDDRERLLIDHLTTWSVLHDPDTARVLEASERVLQALKTFPEEEAPRLSWLAGPGDIRKRCLLNRAAAQIFLGSHDAARAGLHAAGRLPGSNLPLAIDQASLTALSDAWSGSLRTAERHARRAVSIAEDADMQAHPCMALALLALARIARQRGHRDQARSSLAAAEDMLSDAKPTLLIQVLAAESALLDLADDQPERGLDLIAQHRQARGGNGPPWVAEQVDLAESRLLIAVGDLGGARQLMDSLDETGSETLDVRVLLALDVGDPEGATRLVSGWPGPVSPRSRLQLLRWQCILQEMRGDTDELGNQRVDRMLSLADEEGQVQVLHDAGRHGRRLFRARLDVAPGPFLRRLVDLPPPRPRGSHAQIPQLVVQLTEREREVVGYLPTRLVNPEIADELGVSLNTLKTHLKHIYDKLDVQDRRAAVDAAERFGLL